MHEDLPRTIVPGVATVDWCRRCQLSRTTTELWELSEAGVCRVGHAVDCGCYR